MKKDNKFLKILTKILKWISSLILTFLIIIGVLLVFVFLLGKIAQSRGDDPPISLYTIISASMTPNINVYDIVVVAKTDTSKLEKGDVISFYSINDYFDNTPITHRIVEKHTTSDNVLTFRTKGDANPAVDSNIVYEQNVIGKVLFKIPGLGRLQFFLASKGGWFIAILIPALGVIAYDIFKIIKLIAVKNKIRTIKNNSEEIGDKIDNIPNDEAYNNKIYQNKVYSNESDTFKEEYTEDKSNYQSTPTYIYDEKDIVINNTEDKPNLNERLYINEENETENDYIEQSESDALIDYINDNKNDNYTENISSLYKEDEIFETTKEDYNKYSLNVEREDAKEQFTGIEDFINDRSSYSSEEENYSSDMYNERELMSNTRKEDTSDFYSEFHGEYEERENTRLDNVQSHIEDLEEKYSRKTEEDYDIIVDEYYGEDK